MFRRGIVPLLLIALLIFGLASAGRSAAYRAGWSEGYYAAQQADGEEGRAPAPPRYGGYGGLSGAGLGLLAFGGLALFFKLILFVLLFGFLARLFLRPWGWGGGHRGPRHHGHGPHQGGPPWGWAPGRPEDEPAQKA